MLTLNKVILIANVGRTPELRHFPDGTPVATLSVATSKRIKSKETGEYSEQTQWHRVQVVGEDGRWAAENVATGVQVYLEGEIRYGSYIDKATNEKKYTTEILATRIEFFGKKKTPAGDAAADGASPETTDQ